MDSLRVLSLIVNFSVVCFIGLRLLNTECFNAGDINLSLGALIFSVITELVTVSREDRRI